MKINNLDNIKVISGGLCAISGVKASGTKEGKYGVSIIESLNSNASAVFTSNKLTAAPIQHTKNIIDKGNLSLIIANSGNANCFTGEDGIKDCEEMVEYASKSLNIPKDEIAVASTGVIGRKMPMDIILNLEKESILALEHSSQGSTNCAKSIMTTDLVSKEFAVEITLESGEKVKIGGVTKGTGMIAPNMGTMLCFLVTDAKIDNEYIKIALKKAVDDSFNMIVVDGDESTNDIAILMANGKSGVEIVKGSIIDSNFQKGLNYLTQELAKMMVEDGEGASKSFEVTANGAESLNDAKMAVRSVLSSHLFKAAVFGADPNWGRIAAAVGYSGSSMDQNNLSISLASNDTEVFCVKNGKPLALDNTENLKIAEKIMENKNIKINIDLNIGNYSASGWGCDLTYDYVKLNAEYTT